MNAIVRPALVVFTALTILVGIVYPFAVTGLADVLFPRQAAGSLITVGDKTVGSALIGQAFTSPQYFWGRPSATSPMPNNAAASGGSNQGPTNPALLDAVKTRVEALKAADPGNAAAIPVDLVTTSASGLDPDISVAAAYYQVPRIARTRNMQPDAVRALVDTLREGPLAGFIGEPRVNVLALNLALDARR